jgi:hypothetical protein
VDVKKSHSYFIELFSCRKLEAPLFIYSDSTSFSGKKSISKWQLSGEIVMRNLRNEKNEKEYKTELY